MATKSLLDINPYLRDPDHYEQFLVINAGSSAAIELGRLSVAVLRVLNASSASLHAKPKGRRASSERSR